MSKETDVNISKAERRRQAKARAVRIGRMKKSAPWILFIGLVVGGMYYLAVNAQKDLQNRPGQEIAIQGNQHLPPGEEFTAYNSNPPTSGPHDGPVPWGFSEEPIRDEDVIHNLEHGGIWITYKDLDEDSVNLLRDIAKRNALSVVVSPRAENESPVSLASWGRLENLESVDVDAITEYIRKNKNKSPERLAR